MDEVDIIIIIFFFISDFVLIWLGCLILTAKNSWTHSAKFTLRLSVAAMLELYDESLSVVEMADKNKGIEWNFHRHEFASNISHRAEQNVLSNVSPVSNNECLS